jgi:hypothetical protein
MGITNNGNSSRMVTMAVLEKMHLPNYHYCNLLFTSAAPANIGTSEVSTYVTPVAARTFGMEQAPRP